MLLLTCCRGSGSWVLAAACSPWSGLSETLMHTFLPSSSSPSFSSYWAFSRACAGATLDRSTTFGCHLTRSGKTPPPIGSPARKQRACGRTKSCVIGTKHQQLLFYVVLELNSWLFGWVNPLPSNCQPPSRFYALKWTRPSEKSPWQSKLFMWSASAAAITSFFNSVGMKVIYEPFNSAGLEVVQIIFSFVRREGSETLILVLHATSSHFGVHFNFLHLKMT